MLPAIIQLQCLFSIYTFGLYSGIRQITRIQFARKSCRGTFSNPQTLIKPIEKFQSLVKHAPTDAEVRERIFPCTARIIIRRSVQPCCAIVQSVFCPYYEAKNFCNYLKQSFLPQLAHCIDIWRSKLRSTLRCSTLGNFIAKYFEHHATLTGVEDEAIRRERRQ